MRSCKDCLHYEVCYIARNIRDLYHKITIGYMRNYGKLIEWAQGFAEFCLKFKVEKEKTT